MADRYAILSVYDKTGLADLARSLVRHGFRLISTGGTAQHLRRAGLEVQEISAITGFPEILAGRVKSLHPKILGGILARRDRDADRAAMRDHDLVPVELVVVNLYPFEAHFRDDLPFEEWMEWIDIGGPTMVRAAAKNWPDVTVVVDPQDYPALIDLLEHRGWPPDADVRRRLAAKAFSHTARYDAIIAQAFWERVGIADPESLVLALDLQQELRYGENPHQQGRWYRLAAVDHGLHRARVLQGKPLSYNNILDLDAAVRTASEFEDVPDRVAAVVVKHNTPAGVALHTRVAEAYRRARDADALSAFGGIAAILGTVDQEAAEAIIETFMECVIAPEFTDAARAVLARKKNLRVLEWPRPWRPPRTREVRSVLGGVLTQEGDWVVDDPQTWKVVTKRAPTETEWQALAFAWKVVKHVKSNAVLLAEAGRTVGIGAGQVSRVDAVKIAIQKACREPRGTVAASDAFFPFRDSIDELARVGVTAVIQPGGSIRDEEVIAACDEAGMAMVFTGRRHFRH